MPAQVGGAEALCELPEQDEGVQEQVNAWIGKAQARDALTAGGERTVDGLEGIFAEDAIMAEAFGLDEPTVRRKADLAQPRQVVQPPANPEVIGVVERPRRRRLLVRAGVWHIRALQAQFG